MKMKKTSLEAMLYTIPYSLKYVLMLCTSSKNVCPFQGFLIPDFKKGKKKFMLHLLRKLPESSLIKKGLTEKYPKAS